MNFREPVSWARHVLSEKSDSLRYHVQSDYDYKTVQHHTRPQDHHYHTSLQEHRSSSTQSHQHWPRSLQRHSSTSGSVSSSRRSSRRRTRRARTRTLRRTQLLHARRNNKLKRPNIFPFDRHGSDIATLRIIAATATPTRRRAGEWYIYKRSDKSLHASRIRLVPRVCMRIRIVGS
jgi:hypothetical protein